MNNLDRRNILFDFLFHSIISCEFFRLIMSATDLRKDESIKNALTDVLNCIEMEEEREYVSTSDLFDCLFQAYSSKLDPSNVVITVEKSYVGLHLGAYEEPDFMQLIQSFENYEFLHAFYALKIIKDATELLRKMPNIRTCQVNNENETLVVVGDLHGNFRDLKHIIDMYGIPGDNYQFVFNGDFVDRGKQQSEVLITLLYAFLLNPDRVFLNRGNHEDMVMNTHSKFHPNFLTDTRNKFGVHSHVIFDAAQTLFTHLPVATIVENAVQTRFLVVHGGVSTRTNLNFIQNNVVRSQFKRITSGREHAGNPNLAEAAAQLGDILWSDPIRRGRDGLIKPKGATSLYGCYPNAQRGLGCLFGEDVTNQICHANNLNFIIRSHEVRENGYENDHARCFTIFSASYYQSQRNNAAVYIFKSDSTVLLPVSFKTSDDFTYSELHISNLKLVEKFKKVLIQPKFELLKKFKEADIDNSGSLDVRHWAQIICDTFESIDIEHVIALKDHLCVCDESDDSVRYETLFSNTKELLNQDYIVHLENLFHVMDLNHDGKISISEAKEALKLIDEKLSVLNPNSEQYIDLLRNMDTNGDTFIDFNEFKAAFIDSN